MLHLILVMYELVLFVDDAESPIHLLLDDA